MLISNIEPSSVKISQTKVEKVENSHTSWSQKGLCNKLTTLQF